MKILIVDDSAGLHQIYRITLVRYKCPVLTSLRGQEGLDLLAQNPDVDLLIVDMHMPRMNGLEFIKKVKDQQSLCHIPIIAVMSSGQELEWQEALILSNGVLVKPFTSSELHAAVERFASQEKPAVNK